MAERSPSRLTTFGEFLRYLRRRMQLTQSDLGRALGYSAAHITRLEKGERLPDLALVKSAYLQALGLEREPDLAARLVELAERTRTAASAEPVDSLDGGVGSADQPATPAYRLQLLGDFSLLVNGKSVTSAYTARPQSLFAYLALHRDAPQSRQSVAFLFWPDSAESQAHNNLRQLLHQCRKTLPEFAHLLLVDANTIQLNPDADLSIDVADFQRALACAGEAASRAAEVEERAELERAAQLYRGDLLPGSYEDWVTPERERLRGLYAGALERLAQRLEDEHQYTAAIQHTQQLLRLDPLAEGAHLRLMRLHSRNGDRASALRAYHTCVTTLQQELGAAPGATIRQAYARLLSTDGSDQATAMLATDSITRALFVGRQREWQTLRDVWRDAQDGRARFVLIAGEAGIGKSRLAEEMVHWVTQHAAVVATAATARAYAAEGRLAFAPVAEWLRSEGIRQALAGLDPLWLTEVARVMPELLVERPDLPRPEPLAEYGQRQRFFEALAQAVTATAQPLVLVLDDLQWCDTETLEWLHYLLRLRTRAPLLVLGTARLEELDGSHALTQLTLALRTTDHLTEITLHPLDAAEASRLVGSIVGHELGVEDMLRLFRDTEGYPLFIVEAARARATTGEPVTSEKDISSTALPPKVYAVISGRLNRLTPAARELAALAATIGCAFTFDVLAKSSDLDEGQLVCALDELWQRRIIREQTALAYDFSHDKLREVAYAEVSPPQRVRLHRCVVRALESLHAADLDPVAAQLAAHCEQGGLAEQAVLYSQRAATVAQRVFAHEEAVHLLHKGLALVVTLPASPARDERELELQTALGTSLVSLQGYGAPEVMQVCNQALSLCERLGSPPYPPILRALVIANIARTDFRRAQDVARQLLTIAEQHQDRVLIVEGHYSLGVVLFYTGDFTGSRARLEQALDDYDIQFAPTHTALYSQDPRVVCLNRLAFTLWCLGYPDQATMRTHAAMEATRALAHPFSTGYHLAWDAVLQCTRRNVQATQAQTEAVIALGREHRLGQWLPMGLVLHGWTTALQGALEAGMTDLQAGLAALHATGYHGLDPFYFTLMAELHALLGHTDHGLSVLSEGFAVISRSGAYWYEAELHRQMGELLLLRGDAAGAESAFARALNVARAQQAKSFELRAAMRLAQLWQSQGNGRQALEVLSPVYHWFSEGLDTPDLLAAGRLLERLAER